MHHQQAGNASRREHHDADEDDAEVKLPHRRQVGQPELQIGDENGAKDRAEEVRGAADERCKQHEARLHGAEIGGVRNLEVDRGQAAGNACEQAREAGREIADDMGVVSDEFDALGVVAHRIADPSERRAGQRIHRDRRNHHPGRDQIIDLDLRPEAPAEHLRQRRAIGRDAGFSSEHAAQDQRRRRDKLADAE